MPRTCVYCRRELPPGTRRCDYCGSLQPPDTSRPRRDQPREAAPPDRRRALLIKVLIGALVVSLIGLGGAAALVIAQSGSAHQNQAAGATSTRAGSPGATTTPAPSATATSRGATATPLPATTSCGAANNTPLTIKQLGLVDFTPNLLLPDTMPLKPTPVSQIQTGAAITTGNSIMMSVGINLPPAPQVAAVCQVSVKLVAFQALAGGKISNVRIKCDPYYENPGGPVGGGCGGGAPSDGEASVVFSSSAQVGATMTAPLTDGANQPQTVQINAANSNGVLDITVQVAVPGTYTFSVGLWQDNNGPAWSNLTLQEVIAAGHVDHYWGGQACTAAAMQSQLPAPTNPPGEFVCPGGPPQ